VVILPLLLEILQNHFGRAPHGRRRYGWFWWLAYGLLFLAILALLAYLLMRQPEVVYRSVPGLAPDPTQVEKLDEELARAVQLRKELSSLRAELAQNDCPPGMIKGANSSPVAPSSTGVGTADVGATDPAENSTQGHGTSVAGNSAGEAGRTADAGQQSAAVGAAALPLPQRVLVDRLNHAVVLVLTDKSSATGFFIAPEYLVTNRHAVEEDQDGEVMVTSKALGRIYVGHVVATSSGGPTGAADYAVVHTPGVPAVATLALASAYESLTPIISAGYPGLTIINDAGFRALMSGDISAAPELVLSKGNVQAVQRSSQGFEVLVHSGDILQGSSGGPVVDNCGRVIGINTYIAVDAQQSGKVSYALSARELSAFLQGVPTPLVLESTACEG
jgi:serine protease Do